jgi:acetyl-CoA carboxylase/biotin carboxylase 1
VQSSRLKKPFLRPLRAAVLDEGDVETSTLSLKNRLIVEQFMKKMGGKRVIQRILIANNGMAATKSIISMRQWAYNVLGDEKAIEFIAMATRDDLNANAEFVRLADTFVEVPSGSNKNNYANVDLIVKIATEQKVDAVWPGWGHASENPKLPSTLKARGIQFIGPTASVMDALGDKISANILAQSAKVPSIPWSGEGIESKLNAEGVIPEDIFNKACVFNVEDATKMAEKIGYPVMIKASEGGGGKGIRLAKSSEELKTGFIQVQNEVPGSPIFMMQLCTEARHLEVQIVGDEYGNAVALNGRDCSTQRRFQKIFEEGPPIIAPPEIFHEMELAAQRLTQSIGYIGAGTVEYLYNAKNKKFYFLELNPRLQVEHPVTEGITGINLPSVQLQVAMGIPLDHIPEVRAFYGRDPNNFKGDKIDFMKDRYQYPKNHVIAARITAENPDEGFKPTSGKIDRIKFQSSKNVWGYFSVGANGGIHEFADSQFGHLFASGATREDARKALILALKGIDVRGDIRTTVEYLIKLLETKEFKENTIDTSWLDNIIKQKSVALSIDPEVVSLSAVIFKAHSQIKQQLKELSENLLKGQISLQSINRLLSFSSQLIFENVAYNYQIQVLGTNYYLIKINDQAIYVKIHEQPDKSLLCNVNGENYQLFGQEESLGLRMKINGQTVMIPKVFNPSELRSDVTGKIVRYLQQDREFVAKDTPFVEIEAMKMIMALKSTESGQINHHLSPGSIISAGDLIASLQLKDPSKVKQVDTFKKRLSFVPVFNKDVDLTNNDIQEKISLALQGYEQEEVDFLINKFMDQNSLDDILSFLTREVQRFAAMEKQFDSAELDEASVISALIKTNKDSIEKVIPTLVARKQLKSRTNVLMSLLRAFETLPNKFPAFTLSAEAISKELNQGLQDISEFKDSAAHGAISLKAKQLLDVILMPSFQERLESLKTQLLSSSSLEALARQSHIAVSVDLLVVLMSDSNEKVRKAAMEAYIRRVYRSHMIKSLNIKEVKDAKTNQNIMSAEWTFTLKESVDQPKPLLRKGYMNMLSDFSSIEQVLPEVIARASKAYQVLDGASDPKEPVNVLHIGFHTNSLTGKQVPVPSGVVNPSTEDALAFYGQNVLIPYKKQLDDMKIRMTNLLLVNSKVPGAGEQQSKEHVQQPINYFNYFSDLQFQEDPISRNMRPTLPQLLELNRIAKNHEVTRLPSVGKNSFIFIGKEKTTATSAAAGKSGKGSSAGGSSSSQSDVLFLRSISLSDDAASYGGAERNFLLALDELERAILDSRVSETSSSRLFMNILTDIPMKLSTALGKFREIMDQIISKYATRLLKLRIDEVEIKLRVLDDETKDGKYVPIRLIASSSTGGWLTREAYREYLDPISGQTNSYCRLTSSDQASKGGSSHVSQDPICILDPYPTSNVLQKKRTTSRRIGSTYATDFLGLLEVALINSWQQYLESSNQPFTKTPTNILSFEELVLDEKSHEVVKTKRFPGANHIGMLAWQTILKTPQYPEGREVILVANDVTVQSGSFGVQEDEFFAKISEYARHKGLPKVFISCNSGARIGLVDELKSKFKVAWKDENNIALGYEYLYLTDADYQSMATGMVDATLITAPNGEKRYKLDAIIGKIHGIGVENLKGSGLIAGETSRAYDEIFTLSYVTGRSVGIGAYLNRLGQRVIQMQQGPMILTGYSALNKLLGKEVYTSQDQLGGPQIMYPNGVTHQVVANDREGMQAVIDWLSYVPKDANSIAPPLANSEFIDPVNRLIDFVPSKTPYDPRHMLGGVTKTDGSFMTGFLDRGSFKEYLGGWGKSVVVGRGRLGGINVGVIAVETRLSEQRIPADPANPESRESILPQAGQVWFPDSAYKTAQAIQDFNHGENLPLIIFANWRGFSGGTRDMYSEILKYGAMIVDSLRLYKHPVFIYIPPNGELRGGAWVVIDPSINPNKMEMYADIDSRGGILEPPGICEVKYRSQEQLQTMHRLDPQLQELDESLMNAMNSEQKLKISNEIKNREKMLLPIYLQVAHEFADLHDRAGRMKAKQCIREVLNWKQSRSFFYYRILRRQVEDAIIEDMIRLIPSAKATNKIHSLAANEANAKSDFYATIKAKVRISLFFLAYFIIFFFFLSFFLVRYPCCQRKSFTGWK